MAATTMPAGASVAGMLQGICSRAAAAGAPPPPRNRRPARPITNASF